MKNEARVSNTAEVFTPRSLVRDMLSRLPPDVWFDPNKTWLEPAAGDGNFLVEIKAHLLQAGHPERHVLNHQLFSIELLDDNHYVLQLRLGYLQEEDGYLVPGPALQDDLDLFTVSKIDKLTQDLNDLTPYGGKTVMLNGESYVLKDDEVYHHVNHRCTSALNGIDFPGARTVEGLPLLPKKDLAWEDVYPNPEIDEPTIVSSYQHRWKQRVLVPTLETKMTTPPVEVKVIKSPNPKKEPAPKPAKIKRPDDGTKQGGWQVKAGWYGKGMKIRCARPFDGSFWECDHDALADRINEALRSKGKPILGEPGPSEKVFGSGQGLRCPELWTRV